MGAQTIPLWVQILGALYMATGVFRLVCHLPQARRCYDSGDGSHGVSLPTWFGLLTCASVSFVYALLVVGDLPLIVSTGANVAGPVLVIGAVLRSRLALRDEAPQADRSVLEAPAEA